MVNNKLDAVFSSLADPTRRDILKRVARKELSVGEIASPYARHMSLVAVSKHLRVLEGAGLVHKRRAGKRQLVTLSPATLKGASRYLEEYRVLWEGRLDRLEDYLAKKK